MSASLSRREHWTNRALCWSDIVLLILVFWFGWFSIGNPEATKAWSPTAQLLYHALICAAVVAGILTLRWWRPVGFVVTLGAYLLLAASQVLNHGIWLGLAGCMIIGSLYLAAVASRLTPLATGFDESLRKSSPIKERDR